MCSRHLSYCTVRQARELWLSLSTPFFAVDAAVPPGERSGECPCASPLSLCVSPAQLRLILVAFPSPLLCWLGCPRTRWDRVFFFSTPIVSSSSLVYGHWRLSRIVDSDGCPSDKQQRRETGKWYVSLPSDVFLDAVASEPVCNICTQSALLPARRGECLFSFSFFLLFVLFALRERCR